jgi:hypothetical protein
LGLNQLGCDELTVVGILKFGRRDVADLAVQTAAIEPVDVGEGGQFDFVDVAPGTVPADKFGLVEPVDRFGQCVVPRRQLHLMPMFRRELFG